MSEGNNTSGGIGFLGLLTILFIGLKLTGYVDWSWFWVLFPAFFPLVFLALFALFALAMAVLKTIQEIKR